MAVLVALVLAVLAGMLPGHVARSADAGLSWDERNIAMAKRSTPGDRVAEAVAGVRRTGFYVAPELRGALTAGEVAQVEQALARAEVPVFLVWWDKTYDGGYGTDYGALDQLRAHVGVDGFYAIVDGTSSMLLGTVGYEDIYLDDVSPHGRPAAALLRVAEGLAATPAVRPHHDDGSDYWGGPGGGFAAGLLFVLLAYLPLLFLVWLVGRLTRLLGRTS
ncbi:MAG: hypothetical protein ACXVWW_05550 [Nocardioides sp.]